MSATEPVDVGGWDPVISVSPEVEPGPALARFVERARQGYRAPPVRFETPQPLLVGGRHFAVVARDGGLVEASVHVLPRFEWRQLFEPVQRIRFAEPAPMPALVAASAGHDNFFHWLAETVMALLARRALRPDGPAPAVLPRLAHRWQRETLDAFGLDPPLIEVAVDDALVLDAGIVTSLTGPEHILGPHPALLDLFAGQLGLGPSPHRALYLSRLDTGGRRRMANEAELAERLEALGCEVVVPGRLPFAEQARLVREARLVVAPHGAALATLLCAAGGTRGPAVIELFGEAYLNPCFLKLCQGKRLRYEAVVNPGAAAAGVHHHQLGWRADIELIARRVAAAL